MIADEQFLLLIDVPIQDCAQQLEIYEVFNLVIPPRNFSACYNINNRYLGITYDETKAVEISEKQFNTCQKSNRQFSSLNTPLQPLVSPPSCIAPLYTKVKAGIEKDAHYKSGNPYTNCSKCLETDFSTYSSGNKDNAHLS